LKAASNKCFSPNEIKKPPESDQEEQQSLATLNAENETI
jgi:hypothetical protein